MLNEVKDVDPKEKMWLVRSSSKVIGPYCLEDIVQLLLVNQLSFSDEVRRPKARWHYIRDYPYITEAVRSKKESLSIDLTKTSPITGVTQQTVTNSELNFKSATVTVNFDEIKDIEPLKEIPFSYTPKSKAPPNTTAKAYGSLDDSNVKAQLSKNSREIKFKVISLAIIVIIAFASFKGYQKFQNAKRTKEKMNQIVRLYNLKLFEESYNVYDEIKEGTEFPAEVLETLSAARISYAKDTTAVRNFLLKLVDRSSNSKRKAEYLNMIGLSYQYEGDSTKANEFYQKSVVQDPSSEWAIINSGVLKYKKTKSLFMNNDLKRDVTSFYKTYNDVRTDNFENLNYYHFVKALINLEFKDILREEISFNSKEIFNVKSKTAFLKNELQVVNIGLKKEEGTLTDSDYIELIESLPRHGKKFTKNPLLDWSLTSWDFLEELCEKIAGNSNQLMPMMFKAYCALEAGQFEKVEDLMNKSLFLAKGSNHYELMQLHMAFAKSETIKVESLLKKADLGNFAATYYYRGVQCIISKNYSCAKEAFTVLQTKFSDWSFLAQLGLYLADSKVSKQNIYEGSRREPFYKPLLSERASIEKVE